MSNAFVVSLSNVLYNSKLSIENTLSSVTTRSEFLFLNYVECENKFHSRDQVKHKIKMVLMKESHNDITKYIIILKKIQYLLRKVEFENVQFKVDLCRIERFFLTLIMRKYTDNVVRGHRRFKF